MQLRQLMERHRRQRVVLGMKGHIPCYQPHQLRRESRARVLEHVFDMRAIRVLGEEEEPQEWLAEEERDDPCPNQSDEFQKTDATAIRT